MEDTIEKKKIILAVDDNVQQHKEYKTMLFPKYDLRAVKSASEAVSFLNNDRVDLILLDTEMPNISGFEFLEDIRKIPRYMKMPVIIVSDNSGGEFLTKAESSGANGVLTKPVVQEMLVEAIEKAL